MNNKRKDVAGETIGEWLVLGYEGNGRYRCRCSCGAERSVLGTSLRSGRSKSCGHKSQDIDMIGKVYGDLTVESCVGNGKWLCRCICGNTKIVRKYDLENRAVVSCGHRKIKREDMIDKTYGDWKVLGLSDIPRHLTCQCSCGTIKDVNQYTLHSGASTNCGCKSTENTLWTLWDCLELDWRNTSMDKRTIDLTGKTFGEWKVLKHVGYGEWLCECSCENHTRKIIRHTELLNGDSKSCGCKRGELMRNTLLDRYGETAVPKINQPRTKEQIESIESRESLLDLIKSNFEYKPTIYELEPLLGITYSRIIKIIHAYSLEEYVSLYDITRSKYEDEIVQYIKGIDNSLEIVQSDREILNGLNSEELDIYIPNKNLAIEFNGTYWHSSLFKDKKYHQRKTIEAAKHGIRLIHIFEYEWKDPVKQKILKWMIRNIVSEDKTVIYARNCEVVDLSNTEAKELRSFLTENHLQGYIPATVSLGLKYNSELVALMTFGIPRYATEYQWELLRLSYKTGVNIVGGSERLFKHFLKQYNPTSIVSYCDIAKFSGKVYGKLGFTTSIDSITSPNYLWINPLKEDIRTRYQTMKHKLLAHGLGTPDMTENEIMEQLGYFKVYDCGNLRFIWNKQ